MQEGVEFFLIKLLYLLICLFSSIIGAVSGIGGGIIIKPALDGIGLENAAVINFLTSCTVLCMSGVSVMILFLPKKMKLNGSAGINSITPFIAVGAAAGGVTGKLLFDLMFRALNAAKAVNVIQAVLLLIINAFVLLYMLKKDRIRTNAIKNKLVCVLAGCGLGLLSSFLGIGGGPMNIAVLSLLFSLSAKETVINSLFIILISQAAGILSGFALNTVPPIDISVLAVMCFGGVSGALIGRKLSAWMDDRRTSRFFAAVLVLLLAMNMFNIVQYIIA